MKRNSTTLALMSLVLVFSLTLPAMAAEIKYSESGFYFIEGTETQAPLSAVDKDLFIQVDGLYFKDLNKNGQLDPYEDWRLSIEERARTSSPR